MTDWLCFAFTAEFAETAEIGFVFPILPGWQPHPLLADGDGRQRRIGFVFLEEPSKSLAIYPKNHTKREFMRFFVSF